MQLPTDCLIDVTFEHFLLQALNIHEKKLALQSVHVYSLIKLLQL